MNFNVTNFNAKCFAAVMETNNPLDIWSFVSEHAIDQFVDEEEIKEKIRNFEIKIRGVAQYFIDSRIKLTHWYLDSLSQPLGNVVTALDCHHYYINYLASTELVMDENRQQS